jgi:hypothetical protein
MTSHTSTPAHVGVIRYFEGGELVVAQGRKSYIVQGGVYRNVEMVRVMDAASLRTWSMQAWRIAQPKAVTA